MFQSPTSQFQSSEETAVSVRHAHGRGWAWLGVAGCNGEGGGGVTQAYSIHIIIVQYLYFLNSFSSLLFPRNGKVAEGHAEHVCHRPGRKDGRPEGVREAIGMADSGTVLSKNTCTTSLIFTRVAIDRVEA